MYGLESCIIPGMLTAAAVLGLATFNFIKYRRYYLAINAICGTALLAAVAVGNQHNHGTVIGLLIPGIFFISNVESISLTMSGVVVSNQNEIGTAVGLSASLRTLAGGIASTIYTTILTNRLGDTIPAIVPAAAVGAGLPESSLPALLSALSGTISADKVPGITPAILAIATDAYRTAYSEAISTVFLASIAFGGSAIIACWWVPDRDDSMKHLVVKRLHNPKETNDIEHVQETHEDETKI